MKLKSNDALLIIKSKKLLDNFDLNLGTSDINKDYLCMKVLPKTTIDRIVNYIDNTSETKNNLKYILIKTRYVDFEDITPIEYSIITEHNAIQQLNKIFKFEEDYDNEYTYSNYYYEDIIHIFNFDMYRMEYNLMLDQLTEKIKRLRDGKLFDVKLYKNFINLIGHIRSSVLRVSKTTDNHLFLSWYEHCYTLILDTACLIIHQQQELENRKIPGYDNNLGNLISQYFGFNLFLSLPNRNGESTRIYYNPGYENDFVEIDFSDRQFYFLDNEILIIKKEFDKHSLYIRKSDFEKYQFHINVNMNQDDRVLDKAKIDIQHNFLTSWSPNNNKNKDNYRNFGNICGKYKEGKFVELDSTDIKLCKDLDIKIHTNTEYNRTLIITLNDKYIYKI